MNFTYYFIENCNIKAIRIKGNVMTIYYDYRSIYFTKNLSDKNDMIFEYSKDHDKELHKKNNPFDWHVHIKIKKENMLSFIKKLKKEVNFSKVDYDNIINLINNDNINLININNLEEEGLTDDKYLEKFKKILKQERFVYATNKNYIPNQFCIGVAFYILRFSNIKFVSDNKLLNKINNVFDLKDTKILKALNEFKNLVLLADEHYKKNKININFKDFLDNRLSLELALNLLKYNEENKYKTYLLFNNKIIYNIKALNNLEEIILKDDKFTKAIEYVKNKVKIDTNDLNCETVFL